MPSVPIHLVREGSPTQVSRSPPSPTRRYGWGETNPLKQHVQIASQSSFSFSPLVSSDFSSGMEGRGKQWPQNSPSSQEREYFEYVCAVLGEEKGPRREYPGLPPVAKAEALNGKETLL